MITDLPWSEQNRKWVGMDVNIVQGMEEGEATSMPDTGEVSEEEGIYQNVDKQEDENPSTGADLQENTGIEQQLTGGDKLSEPEDSVVQVVQYYPPFSFSSIQLKESLLKFPYLTVRFEDARGLSSFMW